MSWFGFSGATTPPAPEAEVVADTTPVIVAMLAVQYPDGRIALCGAWQSGGTERGALGRAVEGAPKSASIVDRIVFQVPLASGMEAPSGGETVEQGSTEGDSPTGNAGDAQ